MTAHDDSTDLSGIGDTLRWQLRALRRDESPTRELWSGIAAALPNRHRRVRQRFRSVAVAMAASLLLLIGALGWWQGARAPMPSTPSTTLVQREADGLTRQYEAALLELAPVAPPGSLQPTFAALDRDAALIRDALGHAPDSRLLLAQLRRTYARRLALVQRVAYS